MTHRLWKSKQWLIVLVSLMTVSWLFGSSQSVMAEVVDNHTSTASFTVDIDQVRPELPVAQPDIPENGQTIHYSATDTTGSLPQTGVSVERTISIIGLVLILGIIIGWLKYRWTKGASKYED